MANDEPPTSPLNKGHQPRPINEGHQPRSGFANDGHQPRPAPALSSVPTKVQGGYQAPSGGGKPATPTTGSGVKK
jgi:hypothetical protein